MASNRRTWRSAYGVVALMVAAGCGGSGNPGATLGERTLLYVGHGASTSQSGRISAYEIDATSGTLVPVAGSPVTLGSVAPPGQLRTPNPFSLALHPTRPFVYVSAQFGGVWAVRIDADSGALAVVPGSPFEASGEDVGAAVEPSGRFLYTSDPSLETIRAFPIDATTGGLPSVQRVVSGPDLNNASSVAVTPSGRYLYAASAPDGKGLLLWAFALDPATGLLSQLAKLRLEDEGSINDMVVHPSGRFLYTGHSSTRHIRGFAIDGAAGTLTPLPGSPFAASAASRLALTPSGRYAYAVHSFENTLATFAIDLSSGALAQQGAAIPTRGTAPTAIAVAATGRFAYVAHRQSSDISIWALDADTGRPTPALEQLVATATGPSALAIAGGVAR